MIIYKIINNTNNLIYIGQSKLNEIEFVNSNYYGSGVLIRRAIKKYGIEKFSRVVLESCDSRQLLDKRETH